jgi:signal transduction histidine kinase
MNAYAFLDPSGVGSLVAEAEAPALTHLAFIAHELRTPLATQRALLELALADPEADAELWQEIGSDVLDACKEQERLLESCLALSRSQSAVTRSETVDLATAVATRLGALDLRSVTVTKSLEQALTTGDPDLIERLLDNLLTNAVRHNRVGGSIEVTTRSIEPQTLLTVENTGPPIPAGEITRLFEPFQQLTSQNTSSPRGLGLGLAVAKAVATAHGAVISAHARPSGGLRIDVVFPPAHDQPGVDAGMSNGRRNLAPNVN